MSSSEETLTLRFGQDIDATEVTEVAAVFNAATVATAANAIMGAISASPTVNAFALSLDGTSITGAARTLGQGTATDTDGRTAWFHGTTAEWEYDAAYNAARQQRRLFAPSPAIHGRWRHRNDWQAGRLQHYALLGQIPEH